MDRKSRSNSNISIDSLEIDSKRSLLKEKVSDANVDTILVPFYENGVLIKVPKSNKRQRQVANKFSKKDTYQEENQQSKNYLMNKNFQKIKKKSYLEMFRKQFASNCNEILNKDNKEIRSISPELGDTERESFGEEWNSNIAAEFYNTESYNEIYYERLMNQELEQYLNESFEEALRFNDGITSKSPEDINDNDLRSVSEVSRPRRHLRRTTVPFNQNIPLGGLGPDTENIRPRLERAKSLQRYSEKVRMENRLKIYKRDIEAENEKQAEKERDSAKRRSSEIRHVDLKSINKSSYLINNVKQEKPSEIKKNCNVQSKSADKQKRKQEDSKEINKNMNNNENLKTKQFKPNRVIIERKHLSANDGLQKYLKPSYEARKIRPRARSQDINTEKNKPNEVSPVEIRFLVNVGGVRPSSALKSLEEKHRIYQEKVKRFTIPPNKV